MVALVFCGDLKYCPYIRRYIERLEITGMKYTVYFWNRGGYELNLPECYQCYESSSDLGKSKIRKAADFWRFRNWLIQRLSADCPDKIIALSTLTGVLLGKYLYFGGKPYVFDIRDYSYEHIKLFYSIEKKVIGGSEFTAISSKGFTAFLPKHDYIIAHNFNRSDIVEGTRFKKKDGKINFVWNGLVRYFEFQKQYLDALKNDDRFTIIYHGDGPELSVYKKYCEDNAFNNVVFTGSYENNKKKQLLSCASILNNCYGYTNNAGNKLKYAVSNRFYDGMIYHIPQLVEQNGYKPTWAKELGIGISLEPDSQFADRLYHYYRSINAEEFDQACSMALASVIAEDDKYIAAIDSFIR